MLLAKTLRSSTFRLALIAIAAFGLIVAAIMAYVYFGTIAYVQGRVGDAGDHSGFTAMIELAMVAVAVLLAVLAGLAAVLVTRRTVGRIEEINATSRAIMLSGLDRRIPLRGSHDEWDRVAENLNQMLDRIETPLTRMRGRLEKAYHTPRNGEADAVLIGDTIADLDSVLGMFASITRISEIETRARRSAFRTLDLAEIAGEVVELYDAAAEQVATRLSLDGDREVAITGDRDLLFDAIANLVDNAIKHGRAGGQVTVTCRSAGGGAVIAIADDGPGIPTGECDQVFKRFYRLEQSRYTPGNGLGLSLVAAVAGLHGAEIALHDNAPGLTVRLSFPATSAR